MDIDVTILFQLGLFLLALVVLTNLLLKPVMRVIEARYQKIEGAELEAARLSALAATNRDAYLARIRDARTRARREREALKATGNDEKRQLLADVRAEIATAMNDTRDQIGVAELEAYRHLSTETEALARRLVSRVLGRDL
jgi:F0F1-type ATP synthase membrane subunit b/b'